MSHAARCDAPGIFRPLSPASIRYGYNCRAVRNPSSTERCRRDGRVPACSVRGHGSQPIGLPRSGLQSGGSRHGAPAAAGEGGQKRSRVVAGLVHVCRYCGLLEASIAAHEHAVKLDPTVRTSVCHTYFMLGDYRQALETSKEVLGSIGPLALISLGRDREAVALGRRMERSSIPLPLVRCFAHFSDRGRGITILARAVNEGFFCYPALTRDPWLHSLRANPEFQVILQRAQERHAKAVRAFVEAEGGVSSVPSRPRTTT